MKINRNIVMLIATSLLCASCEESGLPGEDGMQESPLLLSSVQTKYEILADDGTKTMTTQSLPVGDAIGVFRTGGGYSTPLNNIQYTHAADGTWSPAAGADAAIPVTKDEATLYAYSPFRTGYTDVEAIPLVSCADVIGQGSTVLTSAKLKQEDICYARTTTSVTKPVSLTMNHALVALDLKFNFINHSFPVTSVTLESKDNPLSTEAAFSLTNETYTPPTATGTVAYSNPEGTSPQNDKITFRILLIPCEAATLQVTVVTQYVTFRGTLGPLPLARGQNFKIDIDLVNGEALVQNIFQYNSWPVQEVTDGSENGDFIAGRPLDGAITWEGLGFYVAPGNLVATHDPSPTELKFTYAFQNPPHQSCFYDINGGDVWDDLHSIKESDHFEWNTPIPWPKKRPEREYAVADDPCQQIDARWFTPSLEQFEKLLGVNSSGDNYESYEVNDDDLRHTFSAVKIGKAIAGLPEEQYIILPLKGYREGNEMHAGLTMYLTKDYVKDSHYWKVGIFDRGTYYNDNINFDYNLSGYVRCIRY